MADDINTEQEKNKEKTRSGLLEKKNLMKAGMVTGGFILVIIAFALYLQFLSGTGTAKAAAISNVTPDEKGVPVTQSRIIQNTPLPTGILTSRQTPSLKATTTVLPVNFVIQSGDPKNCGLTCRQLDASITNTGYETAHNVCIAVALHNSRNEIIYLNGESSINRCIGDISGGQKKTESITINADCGAFATKCIGETLTLQTRVTSDEKTVLFPDQIIAV
ncbi:MAG: hypothetical protein LUQ36_06285 [Methanoregula sp.]|nr:hypothetical protein [Methanoregula sp.]